MTNLIVLVEPEEGEVCDTDGLPMVLDLLSSAVDNMCNFVSYDKLQILSTQ